MILCYDPDSGLEIVIEDVLQHRYFTWPQTLLSYKIQFLNAVREEELVLIDASTSEQLQFQLAEVERDASGAVLTGKLLFFSDLPSGTKRVFNLFSKRTTTDPADDPTWNERGMIGRDSSDSWVVNNGAIQVEIPKSYHFSDNGAVFGPLSRIGQSNVWYGKSAILSRLAGKLNSEIVEDGPLMAAFRLKYHFGEDKRYEVLLRIVKGMDFVEMDEAMFGISEGDDFKVIMHWDPFIPTHRYAPNRPYGGEDHTQHGFRRYPFEEIDRMVTDSHIELAVHYSDDGELPFRLLPYDPWKAVERLNMATFWNEHTDQSVGIFVRKPENWQDGKYAIWAFDDALAIRYFYNEKSFHWEAPLAEGSRSIAICCYNHQKDIAEVDRLDLLWQEAMKLGELCPRGPASYTLWLQQWYSLLDLDKVKDWQLTYSDTESYPGPIFEAGTIASPEELEKYIRTSELVMGLALYGPRQDNGFSPVPSREIYNDWIDGYHRLREQMTEDQRRKITGMYLLMGYMHDAEDYMPLKTMLGGHPNFLADVKGVPALMAVLFPGHSAAKQWVDAFEMSVIINMRYHMRPDLTELEAFGGRWTENIACYVWAFLKPVMRTTYLLKYHYDGKNRLLNELTPRLASWLLNSLSSPIDSEAEQPPKHADSIQLKEVEGKRRFFLPQGAHARRMLPPRYFYYLGQELLRYDPLLAEAIMNVAQLEDADIEYRPELAWRCMDRHYANKKGTSPSLRSRKQTGYGVALRSKVNTPEEAFVMLQQIDKGANYRWGMSGQGGCGVLYYYANGKAYSHNGFEDVGDARLADVDHCTNFGIFKNGTYRSIGQNSLTRPIVDFEQVSFAEIESAAEDKAYAWPEYQSRSVLMAGSDYIVVYDAVYNPSVFRRFSWFVHKDEEFPEIHLLHGDVAKRTELATDETKGIWLDGAGDFMVLVTPYEQFKPKQTEYGYTLQTAEWTDYGFRKQKTFQWSAETMEFHGRVGWIRVGQEQLTLAIIDGCKLRMESITIELDQDHAAMQIIIDKEGRFTCEFLSAATVNVSITVHDSRLFSMNSYALFIDGNTAPFQYENSRVSFSIPNGKHQLQFTDEVIPRQPVILRSVQYTDGTIIQWSTVGAAVKYLVERSEDQGQTWAELETVLTCEYFLPFNGYEYSHMRVTAIHGEKKSLPSDIYPVYFSAEAPLPPEGLMINANTESGSIRITWGNVLGTNLYRLYARVLGTSEYKTVYEGEKVEFTYTRANENRDDILEFSVTAVNGNGEGAYSFPADTDPHSILNWDPMPGDKYRNQNQYQHTKKNNR